MVVEKFRVGTRCRKLLVGGGTETISNEVYLVQSIEHNEMTVATEDGETSCLTWSASTGRAIDDPLASAGWRVRMVPCDGE